MLEHASEHISVGITEFAIHERVSFYLETNKHVPILLLQTEIKSI